MTPSCTSGLLGNTASGPQPEINGLGGIQKADLVQSYALAQRVHRVIRERSNLVRDLPASKPPPFGCHTDHVYFFKANTWPISPKRFRKSCLMLASIAAAGPKRGGGLEVREPIDDADELPECGPPWARRKLQGF